MQIDKIILNSISPYKTKFCRPVWFTGCENIAEDKRTRYFILLDKMQDLSLNNYFLLSAEDKLILQNMAILHKTLFGLATNRKSICDSAKYINDKTSDLIKYLDKHEGGAENCICIMPGRSLSVISEALKYRGYETYNIPMSELKNYNRGEPYKRFSNSDGYGKFRNYVHSLGLTREYAENCGKKFIITDYSDTGISLYVADQIFRSNDFLGENSNVKTLEHSEIWEDDNEFSSLLNSNTFKLFSPIGKLVDLRDIDRAKDYRRYHKNRFDEDIKKENTVLFAFSLMNDLYGKMLDLRG